MIRPITKGGMVSVNETTAPRLNATLSCSPVENERP
jgi:hypothetical protein